MSDPVNKAAADPSFEAMLGDVPLELSVELGRVMLTLREIAGRLGPGSIIPLTTLTGDKLDVRINDRLVARGEAVAVGDRYGVRIVEIVESAGAQLVMRTLAFAAVALSSLAAAASEPVAFDGSGSNRVSIVAKGVKPNGPIVAHGDSIEVPISATDASAHIDLDDATVKHIDLIGGAHARLIVRLHHSKHTTERIAAATIAEDAGGGLKLILPRQPGSAAPSAVAPAPVAAEPIAAAPVAAAVVAPAPVAAAVTAPVAAAAKSVAAPAKTPAPITIVPAEQLGIPVSSAAVTTDSLLDDHKSSPRSAWWVLVALIVGVPALLFAQRRRGAIKVQQPLLRVLASQSLGGKAKLMIVEADGKRILLAVNDQTTRVVANLEDAVAAVAEERGDEADHDDLDLPIDEEPARAESSLRIEAALRAEPTSRNESAVVHLTHTAASVPSLSTVSSSSNSAIAGLLKLRADAGANNSSNSNSNGGPTEWGDALRRAVGRVKS